MGFKKLRGKAPKRRRGRMKRLRPQARFEAQPPAGRLLARRWAFEEVPRLAARKGTGAGWHDGGVKLLRSGEEREPYGV